MTEDREIHSGIRYSIRVRSLVRRDGATEERAYIRHPGAVVIIPVTENGGLVLIQNFRFVVGKPLWEVPAGTLEPGEAILAAAKRELREETGYTAHHWAHCLTYLAAPAMSDEKMHVFIAAELCPGKPHLQPDEDLTAAALTAEEIDRLEAEGQIVDGKTLLALSLWRRWKAGERLGADRKEQTSGGQALDHTET